jgi:hypothetical protein
MVSVDLVRQAYTEPEDKIGSWGWANLLSISRSPESAYIDLRFVPWGMTRYWISQCKIRMCRGSENGRKTAIPNTQRCLV